MKSDMIGGKRNLSLVRTLSFYLVVRMHHLSGD